MEKSSSIYVCKVCGFSYREKEIAERCEAWCGEHKSCNLDIISHAVEMEPNYKMAASPSSPEA